MPPAPDNYRQLGRVSNGRAMTRPSMTSASPTASRTSPLGWSDPSGTTVLPLTAPRPRATNVGIVAAVIVSVGGFIETGW